MNIAFIPVRGGSKSIPLKNIKLINGKPLVYWTVKAACECKYMDEVFVATDSKEIKEIVEGFKSGAESMMFAKLNIIGRSAESASDTASTEFTMLEFANKYEFDSITLIQATSPLLISHDLNRGFELFSETGTDSVLSVVPQKRFNWRVDEYGFAHPTNYDVFSRPRRQEFSGYLVENGAFYITSREALLKTKNRLSGNIKVVEMHEDTLLEIDEPSDWIIIESIMKKREQQNKTTTIPEIKMFLSDCDGCLTDGGMYYSENGDELKKFNTRDGMGFSLLKTAGIITGIVTSESVELNRRRAEKLKLDILEVGCKNKLEAVKRVSESYGIALENICYIGDDINDIEVIKAVGLGCCPNDAIFVVKDTANYVCKTNGGKGVIREIADMLLQSRT